MREIYFDNSATTKMSEGAKRKMLDVINSHYANPSSLHSLGLDAEHVISDARGVILLTLGIARGQRGELVFTSGGTESNNLAILGAVNAKSRRGNEKILISAGEHSSVEEVALYLEKKGFSIIRVPTKGGVLDVDFIRKNAKDAIIASFMHANNETGALYNIKEAFEAVKSVSPSCVTHSDCVQSYMKVKFTKKSLGAELISLSSHKINGAKGVGALYISPEILKAKKLSPVIFGGGQEQGIRSGTENVYGICAFGEAAKEHFQRLDSDIEAMNTVREYIINNIDKNHVRANISPKYVPHILNLTVFGIRSETLLHFLSSKGIFVSSGSACSSNSASKVSRALSAFGIPNNEADSSIRVSLCPDNTVEEAKEFILALNEAISKLARK